MSDNKKPVHQAFYIERDEQGEYTLSMDHPEMTLTLTPVVGEVIWQHISRALEFQKELNKVENLSERDIPLEMVVGSIQGRGFFQALSPEIVAGQQLRGAFGVIPKGES